MFFLAGNRYDVTQTLEPPTHLRLAKAALFFLKAFEWRSFQIQKPSNEIVRIL